MIHQVAPPIMHRINSKPIANAMRERCDMDAKKSRIAYSEKFPTVYGIRWPGDARIPHSAQPICPTAPTLHEKADGAEFTYNCMFVRFW
jgi:hypothetical protein